MDWKRVFTEAAVLVTASVLLAAGSNQLAPDERRLVWIATYTAVKPVPKEGKRTLSVGEPGARDLRAIAPLKDPSLIYLEISGEIVLDLHRAGALFIDARRSEAYEKGHIAGARSIAVWERDAEDKVSALHGKGIPFDQVIVVYCSGVDCQDSSMLSEKLAMAGFYNVYVYKGGFPDWERRGWPVRHGRAP